MLANRMVSLQIISRSITPYSGAARRQLHASINLLSTSSSDSSDSGSDSDKEQKKVKPKVSDEKVKTQSRGEALETLGTLVNELNKQKSTVPRIDVAIPKKPPRPVPEEKPVSTEESRFDEKLASAAKSVAAKIGGDVMKTEMDLLDRLLKKKITSDEGKSEPAPSLDQSDILQGIKIVRSRDNDRQVNAQNQREDRIRKVSRKVDNLQVHFKDDRSTLRDLIREKERNEASGKPLQGERTYAKAREGSKSILRELEEEQKRSELSPKGSESIEDEKSFSTDRTTSRSILHELHHQQKRSEYIQRGSKSATDQTKIPAKEYKSPQDDEVTSEQPARPPSTLWQLYNEQKRVLYAERTSEFRFHNRSFGKFENEPKGEPQAPELSTWAELEKRELNSLLDHPPQNYFQEMIQWTEQGKVWQFPIDNEQGMKGEENVHFSEHVFMERHLKDWCPKTGPIRHFMELVCVGLSKNAFMTVDEKIGHIMWYKDYFGDKRDLLVELGAIENEDPAVLPKPTNKIDFGPHP